MRHFTSDLESLSFQSTNHQLIIIDQHWIIRSCNRAWQHGLHKLLSYAACRHNHYLHLMVSTTEKRLPIPNRTLFEAQCSPF